MFGFSINSYPKPGSITWAIVLLLKRQSYKNYVVVAFPESILRKIINQFRMNKETPISGLPSFLWFSFPWVRIDKKRRRRSGTYWSVGMIPDGCLERSTGWLPSKTWSAILQSLPIFVPTSPPNQTPAVPLHPNHPYQQFFQPKIQTLHKQWQTPNFPYTN